MSAADVMTAVNGTSAAAMTDAADAMSVANATSAAGVKSATDTKSAADAMSVADATSAADVMSAAEATSAQDFENAAVAVSVGTGIVARSTRRETHHHIVTIVASGKAAGSDQLSEAPDIDPNLDTHT